MVFENIIGQERVKKFFKKALQNQRLSHAYLFVGERGVGKEAMAMELAKALFCEKSGACSPDVCTNCARVAKLIHPDVHFIFPAPAKMRENDQSRIIESIVSNPYLRTELWANPMISIDRIREIRRKSSYKSFEGKGRVVIMVDAERMSEQAANAVLKILEEPPEKMYLLMISSRPNLLLPTIISRCQSIKFEPLKELEIEEALVKNHNAEAKRAKLTARLALGSYRRAVEFLEKDLQEMRAQSLELFRKSVQDEFTQILYLDKILNTLQRDSKRVKDLLSLLLVWFRDTLVFKEGQGESDQLIYSGEAEVFKKFNQNFPDADLHTAVSSVEESLEQVDRNVQINLILIVLLNKLRTLFMT